MVTKRQLKEDYVNYFRLLQLKHQKDEERFFIIALLLAYISDYIDKGNTQKYELIAPIVTKIEITKPKEVAKQLDIAFNLQGKLADDLKYFKKINEKTLSSVKHIIPYFPPKVEVVSDFGKSKKENKRIKKLREESEFIAQSNKTDLAINQFVLNKRNKQWNTQRDSRVRKTSFHSGIDMQVVAINDYFRNGGERALYPSDIANLPLYDVYGCRCYLTYPDLR